jgi:DNA modification methylase
MRVPVWSDDGVSLFHGKCEDVLRDLPDNSVDAVVTDPPYELAFMGKSWDSTGIAYSVDLWRDALRVLKPGGHLLAFGGSRTWHRLTCAVEDAGFEIRDSIAWLYGSGFPKSLDVSKAIDKATGAERTRVIGSKLGRPGMAKDGGNQRSGFDAAFGGEASGVLSTDILAPASPEGEQWQGWGTALKPAFEPIVVARKPLTGTVAANVLEHGTGALNIDATRIGNGADRSGGGPRPERQATGAWNMSSAGERPSGGRWPTNVVLDESQAAELDKQTGVLTSGSRSAGTYGLMGSMGADAAPMPAVNGDSGGASRFFPTFRYEAKASSSERPRDGETAHPTVKPLDLMRWLVRLVTPPAGTVLDPFAGSGTTAEACVIEGFRCITVEREAVYLPLIVARLDKPIQGVLL